MELQEEMAGKKTSPPLGILQLEMKVNVTDSQLLKNLKHTKTLNLPQVSVMADNKKILAICGSGPSLRNTHGFIPHDAEILALNGAYGFLCSTGRIPEYFAMLDSRWVNVNFLNHLYEETVFLIASQCHAEIFARLKDQTVGLFHLNTPTTRLVFPDEDLYVGGGGTIGITALALAVALGYRSLIIYGMDSSYDGDVRHVKHQSQNEKEEVVEVWVDDRRYLTSMAMANQVMNFFPFHQAIRQLYPNIVIDIIGEGLFYDFVVTNNNPTTRERELAKYQSIYNEETYGMTMERAKGLFALLSQIPHKTSYLDISCGRGESLNMARDLGFGVVAGTETVDALISEKNNVGYGILPNLSIPDKCYDTVSLIEVIEHLIPEDVVPALYELTRLAKYHIIISAAVYEHWLGGVNLHPSAKSLGAWEEIFRSVWKDKFYRVGSLGGSPCWRVDL